MIRLVTLALLLAVIMLAPAAAAERVDVRAGIHENFGRMVFEWPSPVTYEAAVENGNLVLRFERSFAGPLEIVTRHLSAYVGEPSISTDGRTVTIPLKAAYGLRSYTEGRTVVVDLLRAPQIKSPQTAANQTRVAQAETPQAAQKASGGTEPDSSSAKTTPVPRLRVRSGDHDGFGRLVFDWPRNVDYDVKQDGGQVRVAFSQPARLDVEALSTRLPKTIAAVSADASDGNLAVDLTVPEAARLRHFRTGTRIVLDVLSDVPAVASADPKKPAAAPSTPPLPAAAAPAQSGPATASTNAPVPATTGGQVPATQASGGQASSGTPRADTQTLPSPTKAAEPSAPASAPPRDLLAARPKTSSSGAEVSPAAPTPSPDASPGTSNANAMATPQPTATRAASDAPTKSAAAPEMTGRAPAVASATPAPIMDRHLTVEGLGSSSTVTGLRFTWPAAAPSAVFERSGMLWATFDRATSARLISSWPKSVERPNIFSSAVGTIVRWRLPEGKLPALRRGEKEMIVNLVDVPPLPGGQIVVEPQVTVDGSPRLLLKSKAFGTIIETRDPEVGDRLWIAPTQASEGIAGERRFVEFQLLPTLQGGVVKALADDLQVRPVPEGAEIVSPNGLRISGPMAVQGASTAGTMRSFAGDRTPISRLAVRRTVIFDFPSWLAAGGTNTPFFEGKAKLQAAVTDAKRGHRNPARLALARYMFAHGMAADTLGILQVMEDDQPSVASDPAFIALRGAARYMMGNYTAAGPDLFHDSLDTEREIALWRAALLASQHDWLAAERYFGQSQDLLDSYPSDLQLPFGLLAAESALAVGDLGAAKFHIDSLLRLNPERTWRDRIDYLRGEILAKAQEVDLALDAWGRVLAGHDVPSKAKARFARVELMLATGKMPISEAIAELERLRYGWRGDDLELTVVKRLGELYLQAGDYRNGLITLRDAVTNFPNEAETTAVAQRMRDAFTDLYVGGQSDKMSPLAALALYEEFRELTPVGDAGNAMITRLVGRLVEIELLDRAAVLLKQQVDFRLKGVPQAQAANQLALVYLLDRKPEEALKALEAALPPDAPAQLANERRQLKARTLGELARYKEALALLEDDNSSDADRLRAEIGWRTQNWPLAAHALSRLVPAASDTLNDGDRQTVLRLAIAQSLSQDAVGLAGLRGGYGADMAKSPYKEAFDLITAPGVPQSFDLRTISQQVAGVDQFSAFVTSYRNKILKTRDATSRPNQQSSLGRNVSQAMPTTSVN